MWTLTRGLLTSTLLVGTQIKPFQRYGCAAEETASADQTTPLPSGVEIGQAVAERVEIGQAVAERVEIGQAGGL